jgi:hypothetical protein
VFENRVPKRITEPKWDEVTRDWRELHNRELHNLYCSPNIVRMMRLVGHVVSMGDEKCVKNVEGTRPLENSSRRRNDNFKMYLK